MATKKQLEKEFAPELEKSKAPQGLLQALYALANDANLQGADLRYYDNYKGKQIPSGRQISQAKGLLGIKAPAPKKKAKRAKKGSKKTGRKRGRPAKATMKLTTGNVGEVLRQYRSALQVAVKDADAEIKSLEKQIAAIKADSAEARAALKKL